jgi:hypothetical protein
MLRKRVTDLTSVISTVITFFNTDTFITLFTLTAFLTGEKGTARVNNDCTVYTVIFIAAVTRNAAPFTLLLKTSTTWRKR